jgi:hypothetical protein
MQGPNVKRLIVHKMSRDAVPPGGGVGNAIGFLSDPKKIAAGARAATEWVEAAIAAVRAAPGCTFTTDEEIAGEILRKIAERKS